jgi:hypothetical protein
MCGEIAFTHLWLFSLTFNVSSELLHCHCPSQLNRQAFSLIKIDSVAAVSPPPQGPQWLGLICPDNQQGATLPCPPCTPVTHIEHLLHCTAHDNETFWLYLTSRWLTARISEGWMFTLSNGFQQAKPRITAASRAGACRSHQAV